MRCQQVNNSPWVSQKILNILDLITTSYEDTFQEPILTSIESYESNIDKGKALFNMRNPLIAHNHTKIPCLIYANAAALSLWNYEWNQMIGMPSHLTAPKNKRKQRQEILEKSLKLDKIIGYEGIRVDSNGKLFSIKNTKIWTILDKDNCVYGQAATFNNWVKS